MMVCTSDAMVDSAASISTGTPSARAASLVTGPIDAPRIVPARAGPSASTKWRTVDAEVKVTRSTVPASSASLSVASPERSGTAR